MRKGSRVLSKLRNDYKMNSEKRRTDRKEKHSWSYSVQCQGMLRSLIAPFSALENVDLQETRELSTIFRTRR